MTSRVGWAPAANLGGAREGATATLLEAGQILFAGGNAGTAPLTTAELYTPTLGSSPAGSVLVPGDGETATLLANGEVLAAGGWNGISPLSSTELYDPVSNTWSPAGGLATARYGATATLLANGKVLLVGGSGNPYGVTALSSAELYDPGTNTWSPAGNLATARYAATATLVGDGDVLVAGGIGRNGASYSLLSSAELYDPTTNSWSPAASLATGRFSVTATLLSNGKVLVVGGSGEGPSSGIVLTSAELYDPATNTWTAPGSLLTAHEQQTATLLHDGRVLVVAGLGSYTPTSDGELYDAALNACFPAGNLDHPRFGDTATLLVDGDVLIAGGSSTGEDVLDSTELYTPDETPQSLTSPASAVSQTAVTVAGSFDPLGASTSDCHIDYGISTAYGLSVPCAQSVGATTAPQSVSATLVGLRPDTMYHYRLSVSNPSGKGIGADSSFTTLARNRIPNATRRAGRPERVEDHLVRRPEGDRQDPRSFQARLERRARPRRKRAKAENISQPGTRRRAPCDSRRRAVPPSRCRPERRDPNRAEAEQKDHPDQAPVVKQAQRHAHRRPPNS
jgi:hypothetical protein